MQKELTIQNPLGIHSRPAGQVMKKAKSFSCEVSLIKGVKQVNAKSIVGVLALEMCYGDKVTLITTGDKEEQALNEIGFMLESVFE